MIFLKTKSKPILNYIYSSFYQIFLIIVPLIALFAAMYMGFTGESFACLIVVFGSPVAVSSFAMAQQMGGDENLAGQLVVVTSAFCILTLFVWVYVFSSMGVI